MKIWKIPDQVIRLAIVFTIAIAAMLLIRSQYVPESYGEFGHYRGDAIELVTGRELKYAGWQMCVVCHVDEGEKKTRSYHRTLSCEVCHEPSLDHAEDPGVRLPVIPRERDTCLPCHEYLASRPTGFPQIVEIEHNPRQACFNCHDPHDPTPPEVPGSCSACHAQISRTKAVSHHNSLDCETCHDAAPQHRETPRSFLPGKPVTREFCGQCHSTGASGSSVTPQIELNSHGEQYLCWQCHYPHNPEKS